MPVSTPGVQNKCKTCRETAASGCLIDLCGKCCWPRCDALAHNRRERERGAEGKPRRQLTSAVWHQAYLLSDKYINKDSLEAKIWQDRMTRETARKQITDALLELVRDPNLDPLDDRFPAVLTWTMSPAALTRVVRRLRAFKNVPASSSSASTSTAVLEEIVVAPPRVSVAAAPADAPVTAVAAAPADEPVTSARPLTLPVGDDEDSVDWGSPTSSGAETLVGMDDCSMPPFAPGNQPVLDKGGQTCAHYLRKFPIHALIEKFPRTFGPGISRADSHATGRKILLDWIAQRPELAARLSPPQDKPCLWRDSQRGDIPMRDFHDIGSWVYLPLKQAVPPYPEGTNFWLDRPQLRGNTFSTAVDCCSMYTVLNSVVNGLTPGPATKSGLVGVFAFNTTGQESAARSSSGYCCYETLCG